MNNKERFDIAIDYLKDIKPLKEICVGYSVNNNDLKKHDMENKIKISEDYHTTIVYHLTESNKILDSYEFSEANRNDNYCIRFDKYNALCNKYFASELRYIEKANVFALCNYAVECPKLGTAKVDFIGAYIITPDKRAKLYKIESHKKLWRKIISICDSYHKFLRIRPVLLNNSPTSWNETFGKLFPLANLGGADYACTISDVSSLSEWIQRNEPRRKNTNEQKQINKLLKLPLKEVTKKDLVFRYKEEDEKCTFIERVKDDMICIRYFQHNDFTGEIFETMRFYIDKENTYFCQKNSFNQFVATSYEKEDGAIFKFNTSYIIFNESSSFEGTIIDYFKDIFTPNTEYYAIQIFLLCCIYPLFRKFWEQDYKEVVRCYLREECIAIDSFLDICFRKINSSANSLRKILGVNSYQLELVKKEKNPYEIELVSNAKIMVGAKMLPSLTNEQTDNLFSIIEKNHKYGSYHTYNCFGLLSEMYSLKTAFSITNNLMSSELFCSPNFELYIRFYHDYLRMVKELEMANIYHPQFKDADDIKRMHDEVLEVYNIKKTIIENEKFAKRIETWKKFEYADSSFSVVAPTKAEDIANEGAKLHHCVKSYIRRVADGETNIVFIRKNTDLEKPFFTVEITNDDTIQQVHGFGNKNADTEKGLTEFVEKWAKDKKLTLCDINKIR